MAVAIALRGLRKTLGSYTNSSRLCQRLKVSILNVLSKPNILYKRVFIYKSISLLDILEMNLIEDFPLYLYCAGWYLDRDTDDVRNTNRMILICI